MLSRQFGANTTELPGLLEMFFGQFSHPKVLEPPARAPNGKVDCWE